MSSSDRPAAEGLAPGHFPGSPVEAGHTAPCPRRIRGMIDGEWMLDSTQVIYYWEHPYYPKYLVPMADIRTDAFTAVEGCLLYTSPSPRDATLSRMPSSA